MAVSLLDVLFTARTERSSLPPDRIYTTGALLTAVIVSVLARRRARRAG
jgi:hypothetical protein